LIIQASADIQPSLYFCPGLTTRVFAHLCIDLITTLIKQPPCIDQDSSLGPDNLPCALSNCDETGQPDFIRIEMFVNAAYHET